MIGPGRGNPRGCPGFAVAPSRLPWFRGRPLAVAHKGDRKGITGDRKGIMGNRKVCRPYTKPFSFSKKKN